MQLSTIIVSWNTRDLLKHCLHSVERASRELAAETIVVDNNSNDGSGRMVREQFPQVQLIENRENLGFARGNNQGIRRSQGKYLLLLNSDTEVAPRSFQVLVDFITARPNVGAVGARLLNADGSLQPSCFPMLTPGREIWQLVFLDRIWRRSTYPMYRWDVTTPREVEVIKGACLMLRREALDQVGLLDEEYFMYTEEVDLCYRLSLAGWRLWWVPRAKVVHYGGQSTQLMSDRMYVQLYRSKVQFYRKFGGRDRAERFKRLVRLVYWPRSIVCTMGAPFSPTLAFRSGIYRQLLSELSGM